MNKPVTIDVRPPSRISRVVSVWFRHYRVYTNNIISNGFPPFVEPLFFMAGIGLGLGHYVGLIDGMPYVQFLAAGIIVPSAMYTSAFECSFGTFIRLEFDQVYDGMLASSITVGDLLVGEILFAGTKSLFFTSAVLLVVSLFGLIPSWMALFSPLVGFLTGLMFAVFSLLVTSFVSTLNQFNFYFTGLLTPMFFFSGIIFPLESLPRSLQIGAQVFPLTHSATLVRAFCFNQLEWTHLLNLAYVIFFIILFGYLSIRRLSRRLVH